MSVSDQLGYARCLSPAGRGAVAVIEVSGDLRVVDDAVLFHAVNLRPVASQPLNRVCFGAWGFLDGSTSEEVSTPQEDVIVTRKAPDCCEICCHGGTAAVARILNDLATVGFTTDEVDRCEVVTLREECDSVIIQAQTRRMAAIALTQHELLRDELNKWIHLLNTDGDTSAVISRIDALLGRTDFARRLTQPWSVVLMGKPNVGKSTLMNRLLGYERSIVFDTPGTTRDAISAVAAFDGWPIQLTDTAGLRDSTDTIEQAGITIAQQRLASADLKLLLLDGSQPLADSDRNLMTVHKDALVIVHKRDLPREWADDEIVSTDPISVSSTTGSGIEELISAMMSRLIPDPKVATRPLPITERVLELVEQVRSELQMGDVDAALAQLRSITC